MLSYFARRLLLALSTGLAVLTLVFCIVRILPGKPSHVILGDFASQAAIEALDKRLGLDRPILVQYVDFMKKALLGDWGVSMVTDRPIASEIMSVLPWTLELTLAALLIGAVTGIPLGVLAALRRNRAADNAIRVISLVGLSFPAFVSAVLLLLIFAIELGWMPVISAKTGSLTAWAQSLALPAINLGLINAAYITRVTRSAMLEVLEEDYVRTARAKGVPWHAVVWRHAFGNALLPIVTVIGLFLGILIGNSVLTEIVFNRPGLGKLIVGALSQRDYTMLQGLMVIYTLLVVAVNVLTDLVYGIIDPRVEIK
ncbi:MAG: ABC transporter permease [Hyphomicrobiaceae bacterium]|nr:MAG: ABC transporter permease [Hyphomicrobiaceae bacterium]